jgi:hypothetical protein
MMVYFFNILSNNQLGFLVIIKLNDDLFLFVIFLHVVHL